jgi:hypothetical protein
MNLHKYLIGLVAVVAASSAFAAPSFSEEFSDISMLTTSGWVQINQSDAGGSTAWFQGNSGIFAAASGGADSYIAANFNNAPLGGAVSNWLLTPTMALTNNTQLSFSLRMLGEGVTDTVAVYYSTSGASADVGSTTTSTGVFTLLHPAYSATSDTGWVTYTLNLSGLATPEDGRFAFRYVVDDTSVNGDYIGIDSVSVSAVPEPASVAMLILGLGVLLISRKRVRLLMLAGFSVTTLVAQAAEPQTGENGLMHFENARVLVLPGLGGGAALPDSGMTAYKDPATGKLVPPTAEQAAELAAAAPPAKPVTKSSVRSTAMTTRHGGVGMRLDESTDSFALAYKDADGKLIESCVPGEEVSQHLAHNQIRSAVKGDQQ